MGVMGKVVMGEGGVTNVVHNPSHPKSKCTGNLSRNLV